MVVTSSPNRSNWRVNCEFSQAPVLPQWSWKLCVGFTNVFTDPAHECGSGHLSCNSPSKHLSIPEALCPDGPKSQFPRSISPTKLNLVPVQASVPKHFKSSITTLSHPLLIMLISALRHDSCPVHSSPLIRNVSVGASGLHVYPGGGPGITTSSVSPSHAAIPEKSSLNPGKTGQTLLLWPTYRPYLPNTPLLGRLACSSPNANNFPWPDTLLVLHPIPYPFR